MRLCVVLLVLALLVAATAVVQVLLLGEDDDAVESPSTSSRVKVLSWQPRIFVYKGFLSDEECDHLVTLAKKGDMMAYNQSYFHRQTRTSSGMFLKKSQDTVVSRIEERIAAWTLLPEENAVNMQIQRYQHGQKSQPHLDYFGKGGLGGPLYATVLMYLSTVDSKGGETVFSNAKGWESQPKDGTFSECAQEGLAVKPVKGDAVLFFSLHVDGEPDQLSLHESCPVIQGEKWSATKQIHDRSLEDLVRARRRRREVASDSDAAITEYLASSREGLPVEAVKAIRAAAKLDDMELCNALAAIAAETDMWEVPC